MTFQAGPCDNRAKPLKEVGLAETVKHEKPALPEGNDWFYKVTTLEELLRGAQPLARIEDLAMEDLTSEDARAFLDAIHE